ncbi:MAG TPA: SDR family oxidoreductase [Acidimicrobiales bacterium]|nr:SDR family oxidoreductase [Acidimicrobiales bacterium]
MSEPRTLQGGPLDFSGRVVVVTGGMRGVGRGIAEVFLGAGAEVVVCGRTTPGSDDLPRRADSIASFVEADVRDADQAASVITTAVDWHGRIDVLINNAGGSPEADAAEASPRFVAAIVGLNLLGPMYCAQAANAAMQAQDSGGSIVNIGSVSGIRPSPGTAAYGAAKAGLLNLTSTLAVEWAPKVRVNCVVAGMIATEAALDYYGGEAGIAAVAETVPMRRLGTPEDVAGVCLFLASPLAGYVTGASVVAHGGGERPAFQAAARTPVGD